MSTFKSMNTMSESLLFKDFIQFLIEFPSKNQVIDVPNGCLTDKTKINFHNSQYDEDNDPMRHPYFIIDPFDINHNPGKKVKFNDKVLSKQYKEHFERLL